MAYDDALEDDERDLDTGRVEHDDDEDDVEDRAGGHDRDEDRAGADVDQGGQDDHHDEESADERRSSRAEQRRQEKERRRQARERDRQLISQQAQRIAQLEAAVGSIVQRTDMGQLEAHLTQANDTYRQAAQKLKAAKESGDFEAELAAQEEWYGARKRVDELAALKEGAAKRTQHPARPQVNTAKLAAFQESFFDENPWFDRSLRDEDSRAAAALSDRIAGEGLAADTMEHWRELKARLREQMPHRFGAKTAAPASRQPARSPVGGGGGTRAAQPGGSADEVRIPRAYREYLEQTGDWYDPQRRKAMIDDYKASAKRHGV
jgi:hypothetical protein